MRPAVGSSWLAGRRGVGVLGRGLFARLVGQFAGAEQLRDPRLDCSSVGQARQPLSTSSASQVAAEQFFVERQRRQRADADLEAVRRARPLVGVVLHVPQVAELVLGPRGRAGWSASPASRTRPSSGRRSAAAAPPARPRRTPAGSPTPGPQPALDRLPGRRRRSARSPSGVGHDPVGPGGDLGQQVGVARRRSCSGGAARSRRGRPAPRAGRAVERLLRALVR